MGKQARSTRRLKAEVKAPPRRALTSDRRVWLGALGGLALVVVVGLVAVAVAFAAATTTVGSNSLPQGTQVFDESNHDHVSGFVTYDRVPPAGGPHNPTPLNCGIYTQPVPNENAVHSLEHGAVWITYQPNLPADQVAALQRLVSTHYVGTQRYLILSPYAGLPSPIVASAWGAQLGVDQASDPRLLEFIHAFAGGGQGGEKGGECIGGAGIPAG